MPRPSDGVPDEEIRAWAQAHGHLYDRPGSVPERVLVSLREGKTLRDLYDAAHRALGSSMPRCLAFGPPGGRLGSSPVRCALVAGHSGPHAGQRVVYGHVSDDPAIPLEPVTWAGPVDGNPAPEQLQLVALFGNHTQHMVVLHTGDNDPQDMLDEILGQLRTGNTEYGGTYWLVVHDGTAPGGAKVHQRYANLAQATELQVRGQEM